MRTNLRRSQRVVGYLGKGAATNGTCQHRVNSA